MSREQGPREETQSSLPVMPASSWHAHEANAFEAAARGAAEVGDPEGAERLEIEARVARKNTAFSLLGEITDWKRNKEK